MEIINKFPKPRPILGVCFPQIFLPNRQIQPLKLQVQTSLALLKYFPKHIDSLPSNLSNLKTRIKHLKLIKRIPNDHPNKVLRLLLADKRKTVKFASYVEDREFKGRYKKQNLEALKMLPNLQKVEFCIKVQYFRDEEKQKNYQAIQYYWINKMSNYLHNMPNLKYLKLSNRGFDLLPLLSKLNTFGTMLSRLEVFKLNFGLVSPEDFPDFQALLHCKTILKHLTHLNLNLPEDEKLFPAFRLLPDLCSRLLSLSYFIKQRKTFLTFEEISYLKCLQGFQWLRKLSLYCHKKLDAFRHCKFPMSLRSLDLYFVSADWQSLMTKEAFYNKQEGLENLETLQIFLFLYHPTEEEDIIKDFIKDLLSRILTLRELKIESVPINQERNSSYLFDISHFLSCLQHLNQSLQRLTIQDDRFRYNFTNFSEPQAFHFPELSYLSIKSGTFSSLPVLENVIKLVQAKPDTPSPEIQVKRIKIDSCKSLLELFDSLKRVSGKQVELVVFYENKGEDDEYFKENYEQVRRDSRNLRNVSLEIEFPRGWPEFRWKKELMSLKELFKRFVTC